MSRVGKKPIILPDKVKATVTGSVVHIEGPKGKHDFQLPDKITVKIEDNVLTVIRATEEKPVRSLHGTIRALIYNVIVGLTEGFKRELEIVGMGLHVHVDRLAAENRADRPPALQLGVGPEVGHEPVI